MKSKLVDLIIPVILIVGCFILMVKGIDSEVKSILTLAAGWAFHSIVRKSK